jgi:hypothetical protein
MLGAKGDGVTDDTAAFATAIASVNTAAASGVASCLYVPPGRYLINGATLPSFSQNTGGGICGAGSWKSVIQIGSAYVGDLFSWSDSWDAGIYSSRDGTVSLPAKVGARVEGLTVFGNRASAAQQNAFVFYDHTDWLYFNDVTIDTLNGRAFYAGAAKNDGGGYLRESVIQNFRAFHAGTASAPAVEITATCSTSCVGADASNEIRVSNVNNFASASLGLAIRNAEPANGGKISDIQLSRVRVEADDAVTVNSDLVWWGDAAMTGAMARISCDDCEFIGVAAGYYALRIAGPASNGFYYYSGSIFANSGNGLRIDAGNNLFFHFKGMTVGGTSVTVASSATVAQPIVIDDGGREAYYSWVVDPSSIYSISNGKGIVGIPGASTSFVAPLVPNSDIASGNLRGVNATDWQTMRYSPTQVASGQDATIAGGSGNIASGADSVVCGGFGNVASGFRATTCGGIGNVASGQYSFVAGMTASDLGLVGAQVFGAANRAQPGDNEQLTGALFNATTSSTTPTRLTADGNAAGVANILSIPNNFGVSFDLRCHVYDTATGGRKNWLFRNVLMSRGASAAQTYVAAPPATDSQSIGTIFANAPTLAADSSGGGLSISVTPLNADASFWQCVATGLIGG